MISSIISFSILYICNKENPPLTNKTFWSLEIRYCGVSLYKEKWMVTIPAIVVKNDSDEYDGDEAGKSPARLHQNIAWEMETWQKELLLCQEISLM